MAVVLLRRYISIFFCIVYAETPKIKD